MGIVIGTDTQGWLCDVMGYGWICTVRKIQYIGFGFEREGSLYMANGIPNSKIAVLRLSITLGVLIRQQHFLAATFSRPHSCFLSPHIRSRLFIFLAPTFTNCQQHFDKLCFCYAEKNVEKV